MRQPNPIVGDVVTVTGHETIPDNTQAYVVCIQHGDPGNHGKDFQDVDISDLDYTLALQYHPTQMVFGTYINPWGR